LRECGALIHGHTGTSHTGKAYHYYKCKNAVKHQCDVKPIKKDELEDFVVKSAMEYILSPDIVDKAAQRMVKYFNLLSKNNNEIKILEDMEKEIERKLGNCLNAVANGMANKSIADMITSLEEDKAKVEESLMEAKNKKRKQITTDQCYQFLISLAFLDISKERNKEILINSLVKKVYLYKDKIKIVFYLTDDVEDRSFDDGNGGTDRGTPSNDSENYASNGDNSGSLTSSFCPP
jgi:putative site-specific recombinase